VTPERLAALEASKAFESLATSKKKGKQAQQEIDEGAALQKTILAALQSLPAGQAWKDRRGFLAAIETLTVPAPVRKAILAALGERDETAEIRRDEDGEPEPDPELRDTENVPLKNNVQTYFEREVTPPRSLMPSLYQPAILLTVSPVPVIFGRPPRILGSRSIRLPISIPDAILYSLLRAATVWARSHAGLGPQTRLPYATARPRKMLRLAPRRPDLRSVGTSDVSGIPGLCCPSAAQHHRPRIPNQASNPSRHE